MRINPYTQIAKLLKRLDESGVEKKLFVFADGSEIELFPNQIESMFDSLNDGAPNEDAQFFLDKFDQGIYDDDGFVHLVEAYDHRPEKMAKLWGNEYES